MEYKIKQIISNTDMASIGRINLTAIDNYKFNADSCGTATSVYAFKFSKNITAREGHKIVINITNQTSAADVYYRVYYTSLESGVEQTSFTQFTRANGLNGDVIHASVGAKTDESTYTECTFYITMPQAYNYDKIVFVECSDSAGSSIHTGDSGHKVESAAYGNDSNNLLDGDIAYQLSIKGAGGQYFFINHQPFMIGRSGVIEIEENTYGIESLCMDTIFTTVDDTQKVKYPYVINYKGGAD